jgi:hypothetical protein
MTVTQSEAIVLDKPEQIAMFHLLQIKHALRLEIRTGMKFSNKGSLITLANRCGYSTKRTKAGVLADIEALIGNPPF